MTGTVLVRGIGDVGSAVAHALFRSGHRVIVHDGPAPTTHRRGMAFADAMFDGTATLAGVNARRIDSVGELSWELSAGRLVPVTVLPFEEIRHGPNSIPSGQRTKASVTPKAARDRDKGNH
jgi:xanthine dehydrogenase accessory factor